jgi:predicted small lipoprotein YifL
MKKKASFFLGCCLLFLATGCGRKGPLQEPLPRIPQKVEDFRAVQQENKIIFSWQPPRSYLDGRPLEVAAAEIYGLELRAVPSSEQELALALKKARLVQKLAIGQILMEKNRAVLSLLADEQAGRTYVFVLRVKGKKGGWSEFSNPAVITIESLPAAQNSGRAKYGQRLPFLTLRSERQSVPSVKKNGFQAYPRQTGDKPGEIEARGQS